MTINDILTNRAKLRDGIKGEMQKLLTGWGMWMETIEISDVKICSSTLFSNMQVEFREENRVKAHRLESDSDMVIKRRQANQNSDFEMQKKKQQSERNNRAVKISADEKKISYKNASKKEVESMNLHKAKHETNLKVLSQDLEIKEKDKEQELATRKKDMQLENEMLTENVMNDKIMGTINTISNYVYTNNAKLVNINNKAIAEEGGEQNTQNMLGHMIMQYQAISNATK